MPRDDMMSAFQLGQFLRHPKQFAQSQRTEQDMELEDRQLKMEMLRNALSNMKLQDRIRARDEAKESFGMQEQMPGVQLPSTPAPSQEIAAPIPMSPEAQANPQLAGIQSILAGNRAALQGAPIQNALRNAPMTIPGVYGADITARPRTREEVTEEAFRQKLLDMQMKAEADRYANTITWTDPTSGKQVTAPRSVAPILASNPLQRERQEDTQKFTADENEKNRVAQEKRANIMAQSQREKAAADALKPPKGMSGEGAKVYAIATTMVPEIAQLKVAMGWDQKTGKVNPVKYKSALWGITTGKDRALVKLMDQVADKVGRLRSGGAINKEEEARFTRGIASFWDIPFGYGEDAIAALDALAEEANSVAGSIKPGGSKEQAPVPAAVPEFDYVPGKGLVQRR